MHEDFYNAGILIDPDRHWGVGWTSLQGSFSDCLPVWNEARDLVLFFHGEHHADRRAVEDLKQRHAIAGALDASHLIHLYEERGEQFFQELNGFFHGVLIDFKNRRVVLFNDRYGMQRLYYHEAGGTLLFASEAKAVLKLNRQLREIVPERLGEFLSMQCVLENKTLFRDVLLLPGAARWTYRDGVCESKEQYFQPDQWENRPPVTSEQFYESLKETYRSVLPGYLESPGPVGLSLTGGLDSRLILAGLPPAPGSMACYTFASGYNDSVDLKVAREVAQVCGQNHSTIRIDRSFLDSFAQLAQKAVYISDGNLDAASGAVELHVNKIARRIAPVRVTGNYGSEILRTVRAFRHRVPDTNVFTSELIRHCENARQAFTRNLNGHPLTFAAFRQAPWYNYNRRTLEQSQLDTRTPFMDNRILACAYGAPAEAISNDEVFLRLLRDLHPALAAIRTNRGAGPGQGRMWTKLLGAYQEFWHKAEHGYDYNLPQFAAKLDLLLKPLHLERVFLGREKFFFFRIWYRDHLAEYLKEVLLDPESLNAPFVNRKQVESMVLSHTKGHGNHTKAITMLLTYVLTRRLLLR